MLYRMQRLFDCALSCCVVFCSIILLYSMLLRHIFCIILYHIILFHIMLYLRHCTTTILSSLLFHTFPEYEDFIASFFMAISNHLQIECFVNLVVIVIVNLTWNYFVMNNKFSPNALSYHLMISMFRWDLIHVTDFQTCVRVHLVGLVHLLHWIWRDPEHKLSSQPAESPS